MSRASIKQPNEWIGGEDGHYAPKTTKRQERTQNIIGGVSIVGGLALAATAASLEATGVLKVPSDNPDSNPPIVRHGGHAGQPTHPNKLGTGSLRTNNGNFHLSQSSQPVHEIGTAIAVKKQGDKIVTTEAP